MYNYIHVFKEVKSLLDLIFFIFKVFCVGGIAGIVRNGCERDFNYGRIEDEDNRNGKNRTGRY